MSTSSPRPPTPSAPRQSTPRVVVVGTGTGIGKTHLGVTLLSAASHRGISACGLKPIESGVPTGEVGEDAAALAACSRFHVKHPPPYALPDPVSPHLAARRAGVTIDLAPVRAWVDAHSPDDLLLVETAGALLSPVAPGLTNLDLARSLSPDLWLLVAPDRLGVLHDVAAATLALRTLAGSDTPLLVALQAPEHPDTSTGTNAAELRTLGIASRVFELPRAAPDSPESLAAAAPLLDALLSAPPAAPHPAAPDRPPADPIHRGDLHWLTPDSARGSVPPIAHPHLVLQDDLFNASRLPTVIVCALTSNLHRATEPGNVLLDPGEGDLPRQSVVVVSQLDAVPRTHLGPRIGSLSPARVDQVLAGLRFQQQSFFRR